MEHKITEIDESDKRKAYLDEGFRRSFFKRFERENVGDKGLEKFYRTSYKDKLPNLRWVHHKVYFHPDVTVEDFDYIDNKITFYHNFMKGSVASLAGMILYFYTKTEIGKSYRKNPRAVVVQLSVLPPILIFLANYGVNSYIDTKVTAFNWQKKYQLSKILQDSQYDM